MGQIHDAVGLPCDPALRMLCRLPHDVSPDIRLVFCSATIGCFAPDENNRLCIAAVFLLKY
jgi:hypothetical protein